MLNVTFNDADKIAFTVTAKGTTEYLIFFVLTLGTGSQIRIPADDLGDGNFSVDFSSLQTIIKSGTYQFTIEILVGQRVFEVMSNSISFSQNESVDDAEPEARVEAHEEIPRLTEDQKLEVVPEIIKTEYKIDQSVAINEEPILDNKETIDGPESTKSVKIGTFNLLSVLEKDAKCPKKKKFYMLADAQLSE